MSLPDSWFPDQQRIAIQIEGPRLLGADVLQYRTAFNVMQLALNSELFRSNYQDTPNTPDLSSQKNISLRQLEPLDLSNFC